MADHVIPTGTKTLNGTGNYNFVVPGDRLIFPTGTRDIVEFQNFTGTAADPIVVTNFNGACTINTTDWLGIDIDNCEHMEFDGSGHSGTTYGFDLTNFSNSGIYMREGSRYIEIHHIEIHDGDASSAGIRAYSDESLLPPGWIQYGPHIHHCYIHDVTREAMYLGQFLPPADNGTPIRDLLVHNNLLEDIGWEGIQARSVESGCEVYQNTMINCGWDPPGAGYTGSGLECQDDTGGDWHHNVVIGAEYGIWLNDHRTNTIVRYNLFVNINLDGVRWGGLNDALVHHNTIATIGDEGVYVNPAATGGEVYDNFLVACVTPTNIPGAVTADHNVEAATIAAAVFHDEPGGDYRLGVGSPAIGAARDSGEVGAYGIYTPSAGTGAGRMARLLRNVYVDRRR